MSDLIDTTEMYLRTIYELVEEGIVPLRARIAERLHQSGPTVSQTVARMERDGLLTVEGDRHLELTDEGTRLAVRVMRKHRLAERLLTDVIGLEWEHVHAEACRWEHVMSETVERRLVELLGLWNDEGNLQHVGVTSSFTMAKRAELVELLAPYREGDMADHPWREWAAAEAAAADEGKRLPGATSRWNRGKDLSWQPLRPELVCEVAFDHLQGDRFRHAATFVRWRTDRSPADCRYDQLEETPPALLADLFGA